MFLYFNWIFYIYYIFSCFICLLFLISFFLSTLQYCSTMLIFIIILTLSLNICQHNSLLSVKCAINRHCMCLRAQFQVHSHTHNLLMTLRQPRAGCQPSHTLSQRKAGDLLRCTRVDVTITQPP